MLEYVDNKEALFRSIKEQIAEAILKPIIIIFFCINIPLILFLLYKQVPFFTLFPAPLILFISAFSWYLMKHKHSLYAAYLIFTILMITALFQIYLFRTIYTTAYIYQNAIVIIWATLLLKKRYVWLIWGIFTVLSIVFNYSVALTPNEIPLLGGDLSNLVLIIGNLHIIVIMLSTLKILYNAVSSVQKKAEELQHEIVQKEKLKDQLFQSQKMDAIGHLAGGVAHDFNNLLSGMLGASELMKTCDMDAKGEKYLNMITRSIFRASDLTKQLLTVSRKSQKDMQKINISDIISETVTLLKRTINKNIEINYQNDTVENIILGDATLLTNAFMNIGINAAHAMVGGGELTFSLRETEFSETYCEKSPFKLTPGMYAHIAIKDNGTGMPPEVQEHIFEPFYTTKKQGKGTGLGLSTVYGLIQDHNGAITVYTEQGVGTIFHIYLPISENNTQDTVYKEEITHSGTGMVLLADDEDIIRETAAVLLENLGYTVLAAKDGIEAYDLYIQNRSVVKFIIMDMMMPKQDGITTIQQIRNEDATVPIIVSSGFAKDEDVKILQTQNISAFLQKPFRNREMVSVLNTLFP